MDVVFTGVLTLQREQDTAYGLTLVWSLIAVYSKQKHLQSVMVVSLGCIVVLLASLAYAVVQKQRQRKYSPLQHSSLEEALQS